MAGAKRGDSKQALTISLVLFVLLSIILGIVAFFGYSEQEDLRKAAYDAKKGEALLKTEASREKLLRAMYKTLAGHDEKNKLDPERDDANIISNLKREFPKEFKDEIDFMRKQYKNLPWEADKDAPSISYVKQLNTLKDESQKARKELDDEKKRSEDLQKALKDGQDELTNEKAKFAKELKKAQDEAAAAPMVKSEGFKKLEEQIKILQERNKQVENELAQVKEERIKEVAKLDGKIQKLSEARKQLEVKLAPVNMLDLDQPKAKIVSVERSGSMAYIDLGSADRVRTQLTFSIFDMGANGKRKPEMKGTAEVIEVVDAHLSKVAITGLRNRYGDPIRGGELLFNPSWSPNIREHVAVAGLIDLAGDGRDGTAEFVRNLERQGVVVDAYVDLRANAVKGKGLTRNTSYLVVGDNPGSTKATELENQATQLAITVVPARKFVALMGLKMPRAASGTPDWSYPTRPGGELMREPAKKPLEGDAPPKEIKKPEGDAPPKEMKKDDKEMKKDDKEMKKDDKEMKKDDKEMKKDA